MLKTIAEISPELVDFIEDLDLPPSRPHKQHIAQVADSLITTEGSKTLSGLYRNIVGDPRPKAAADTFREAPWCANDLRTPLSPFCDDMAKLISSNEKGIPPWETMTESFL